MNNKFTNFLKNHWFNIIIFLIGVLGVWLRVHVYLFNRSLWMDEAALANNLLLPHSILDNMTYQQAAPPLFKLISLINIKLFGETEYIFRLFPLICGILAIPMFWLIVKRVLSSKLAQAAAMMLFSINYLLIYYSSEFKQYSTDVLCALVLIWLALKFDIKNCSIRALVLLSAVNASVFWLSHGSLFVMAGIFIVNIFILKNNFKKNIKRLAILYLPALLSFIVFYFLHLKTIHHSTFMHEYWAKYFIDSFSAFIQIIQQTCKYVFFPCANTFLMSILMILGICILLLKDKKSAFITTMPVFILILLSIMRIYPFDGRLVLFTTPLLLIYFAASLELVLKGKSFLSGLIIIIFIFTNIGYICLYPKVVLKPNIWLREELRTLYEYLEVRLKPDDVIFTANDMYQQNKYYMRKFKFSNKIIETRQGSDVPFHKMERGKRYMVIWDCYWNNAREYKLPKIVKWLSENTRPILQYAYFENYIFYVEKL